MPPTDVADAVRWLEDARAALAAGDLARASGLLTAVLEHSAGSALPEARELLGLARERSGQRAHARAEYQAYLEEHPDGEGAARVRQRLGALELAAAAPVPKLREASPASESRRELRGSAATYYRRFEYVGDGGRRSDSYLLGDLFLQGRALTDRLDLRAESSASTFYGLGRSRDETRVRSLFLEAEDRLGPLFGSVGRHAAGTSAALGRYDGLQLGYRLAERWRLSAVGGFPVDLYAGNGLQTESPFYGVTLDATGLAGVFDARLFAVHETTEGMTAGSSLGGELRYASERAFASAFVDYDAHFGALDAAILTGSYALTPDTTLSAFADHRYLPGLSLRNAAIGQPSDSLDDLRGVFSEQELDALAQDRSARSTLVSLGLTHRLSERFELAGDLSLSEIDGTPSSGGVEGYPGTGLETWYQLQLVGSDLVASGDTSSVGLRYVDGRALDRYALLLAFRLPLRRRLRLGPRLLVERRDPAVGESRLHLRPGVQLEVHAGPFTFDGELALEWSEGELARALLLGVRYDF
jgi:hypothetical protein